MSNEFDFSEVVFEEVDVVTPDKMQCVLRQASGEAAIKYRKQIMSGMRMADGKVGGNVDSMAAGEPLLVHLCLYFKDDNNANKRVPLATIEAWPYPVMKKLYDKAMEISDLNPADDDEEQRGNESDETPSGLD